MRTRRGKLPGTRLGGHLFSVALHVLPRAPYTTTRRYQSSFITVFFPRRRRRCRREIPRRNSGSKVKFAFYRSVNGSVHGPRYGRAAVVSSVRPRPSTHVSTHTYARASYSCTVLFFFFFFFSRPTLTRSFLKIGFEYITHCACEHCKKWWWHASAARGERLERHSGHVDVC